MRQPRTAGHGATRRYYHILANSSLEEKSEGERTIWGGAIKTKERNREEEGTQPEASTIHKATEDRWPWCYKEAIPYISKLPPRGEKGRGRHNSRGEP